MSPQLLDVPRRMNSLDDPVTFHLKPSSQKNLDFVQYQYFETTAIPITLSCTLCCLTSHKKNANVYFLCLQDFDDFIFAFFAIEMVIKMVALGIFGKKCYLGDTWNRLDFFIVVAGWVMQLHAQTHAHKHTSGHAEPCINTGRCTRRGVHTHVQQISGVNQSAVYRIWECTDRFNRKECNRLLENWNVFVTRERVFIKI